MDCGFTTGLAESPSKTNGSHSTDENKRVVLKAMEPGQSIGIKAVLMSYILETL